MRLPLHCVALALLIVSLPALAEPRLLASIRPLQLIAIAVTGDPARVDLLVEPNQSHHDYQLRPSDRLRLQQAELVLWIGPTLEGFLRQPLAVVPPQRVLMFGDARPADAHDHDHGHGHDHGGVDGHLWLDPERAVAMAQAIADRLGELEPAQRERWQRNSARFAGQVRRVDAELQVAFAALPQRRGYLVLHDAYGHFERHFGLERAATWAATPEQAPGARHLLALQRQIGRGDIGCVLTEPQFEPPALLSILADAPVRRRELDLMAAAAPLTDEGFAQFLKGFGRTVIDCLQP